MEQWRSEFLSWRTEEEYEEFAQALCLEFQNWKTHQEGIQEYGNQFLLLHFERLPIDVIRAIKRKVWKSISQNWCRRLLPFGARELPSQTRRMMRDAHTHILQKKCNCWDETGSRCWTNTVCWGFKQRVWCMSEQYRGEGLGFYYTRLQPQREQRRKALEQSWRVETQALRLEHSHNQGQ